MWRVERLLAGYLFHLPARLYLHFIPRSHILVFILADGVVSLVSLAGKRRLGNVATSP